VGVPKEQIVTKRSLHPLKDRDVGVWVPKKEQIDFISTECIFCTLRISNASAQERVPSDWREKARNRKNKTFNFLIGNANAYP
jgi:hypothetical protein